jgi:arsenite methyltransferase
MTELNGRWSRWLLRDRFGGDPVALQRTMEFLEPIRDRVLEAADIGPGDVVLDVGCGDGFLGFGALPLVGDNGSIVFSDVSEELVDRCRQIARELGVVDRCTFAAASADSLVGVADGSVDVVLTRSVLIYVEDKAAAFAAFHRVLRPGGRVSLFEPINRRGAELNRDTLLGYDATPIPGLAAKLRAVFEAAAPPQGAMMGFDETDLLRVAEAAGFSNIAVNLELSSTDGPAFMGVGWSQLLAISPNPNAPTFGEAIERSLTPDEATRLESYLRPLVEEGRRGRTRHVNAYLTAQRARGADN